MATYFCWAFVGRSTSLFFLILLATGLSGQSIFRVNGLTGDPSASTGKYDSITAAVGAASFGDIVLVEGVKNGTNWYGYTEVPHPLNPVATGETFPIDLDGVTVVKNPNVPDAVFVFTDNLTTEALFRVIDRNGVADETRIQDIFLAGGKNGVKTTITSADHISLILENVRFIRNGTGLLVTAYSSGEIGTMPSEKLEINDCVFFYTNLIGAGPGFPAYQKIGRGLHFQALEDEGTPGLGRIKATISNLSTSGTFEDIWSEASLITAWTLNDTMEFGSQPGGTPQKISTVTLQIQGGDLHGRADSANPNWGWAYGISTDAKDPGTLLAPFSYASACRVEVNGATIQHFRTTGIYIIGDRYTRSHVDLGGNTTIQWIGSQMGNSNPGSGSLGAGLFAMSAEAYISLEANGAEISNNWGSGIEATCGALIINPTMTFVPWGVYIGLVDTEIYLNGGDGLYLQATTDGIIGGTWNFLNFSKKVILQGDPLFVNEGDQFLLKQGSGEVDRCAIHNNGFKSDGGPKAHGVVIELWGDTISDESMAALGFSNSIVWNNEGEGFFYDVGRDSDKWILAAPLVHCTVVGNGGEGSNGSYNAELRNNSSAYGLFQWEEVVSGSQKKYLNTKFLNTIFERQDDVSSDIGPTLFSLFLINDTTPLNAGMVKVRGLRTHGSNSYQEPRVEWYTTVATPFQGKSGGSINWATLNQEDFYLNPVSNSMQYFQETPNFYGVEGEPGQVFQDIQPVLRPPLIHYLDPTTSDRDKGAHQTPSTWQ